MKTMLKKSLALLLALTMVFGAAPLAGLVGLELPSLNDIFADKAEAATYGVLTYKINDGQVIITDCDKSASGALEIPSSIEGYSVMGIGSEAFRDCTGLTSVTIPDGVTGIGHEAFCFCTGLTSVTIPDGVTSIGEEAFYGCSGLTSITISDSVISIGREAFQYCTGLTSVTISDSVISIGDYAFYDTGLFNDSSNWESDVLYIGNYLIVAKDTISGDYVIKSGTKVIADWAFFYCTELTSVTIPDSVMSIGSYSFSGRTRLTSITVDENNKYYSNDEGCVLFNKDKTHLIQYPAGNTRTTYTIPDSVTSIGDGAFHWCDGITSIAISNSVTSIGEEAFSDCTGLTSITIPNSVTSIGSWAFYKCTGLTSVTIPDSVKIIHKSAFRDCTGLTSVTVHKSVKSIYSNAFHGCTNITDVYYSGTEEEWNAISISSNNNENLTNATIHFNSSGSGTTPEIPASQNIKVMTYNVYCENKTISGYNNGKKYDCSYDNRIRYIVQSIYDNMPDSIGMQEVTKDMRQYLENYEDLNGGILSANYAGVGEYRSFSDKGNNEASLIYYNKNKFNLISSGTFWLSESGLDYSKHSGADYQRICTYALLENKGNGLRYLHVNTHLEHDHSSKPGGTNDAAVSSIEKIIDFIEKKFPNIPAVITGDFNQTSSSVPYKNFIDAGYSDTRKIYSENKNTYTNCFNQGENGSLYAPKVIDHILVNKYFSDGIKNYTVYDENYSNKSKYGDFALDYPYPSDHNPVIAELEATYSGDIYLSKNIDFKLGEKSGKVEVVFKDEWFEKSNGNYNHSLAQFCSDYVMMGYCYNVSEITNYLSQMGFGNVDSNMNTGRDEVNYFIASKDININGNKETLVFAAFIGSWHDQWYSNFDPLGTERANWSDRNAPYASGTTDHLGFADAREYVYAKLKTYIKNLNVDKENIKLLLSGHSRGAATANLLAAKLIDDGINNLSNSFVKDENIYTYTFATPNTTSNKDCLSKRYSSIFNIVNPEDFVTKVLPNDWGFQRYGNTFILPSKTNDSNNKAYLKAMNVYYDRFTYGGEYKPYSTGEMSTVKMLKEITSNVDNVNDFYNKYFYASDLFNNELFSKNYSKANPFEFFKYSLLDFLSENNIIGAVSTILTIISNPFSKFYKDILLYFFELDLLDSSLNPSISIKFAQAHGMETYAAYMNSMTSSQIRQPRLYFENTVNCPVDIEVYDNNTNELVGKITDNSIDETVAAGENAIAMDVDGDSKSFWLPSNGNYRVVLVGNDEGKMDYTVSNVNSDTGEIERLNFFDVNIENDVSMHGDFSSSDFALEDYTLTHDNMGTINPTQRILDTENANNISIDTSCEGNGIVDGSFKAISGDYATVSAYANEGGCFTGWFENGKLVSKEMEYSFVAKNSRNLTARFADFSIKTPSTATINYGDSIILHADIDGTLPEGARIEWTASNGNFSVSVSADGTTCKISPKSSGKTVFTATVYDKEGNLIGTDTQEMTAKAGLWQKIVAFFKKIFGLTKTFPEAFKGIL